jgi:hypothetical protein
MNFRIVTLTHIVITFEEVHMLKLFFHQLLCCAAVFSSGYALASIKGTPEDPLHVVMIDACFLPRTMNFLDGKHVVFEFITSASPTLKRLFNPRICTDHYNRAVGPNGKNVGFHARFIGKRLESASYFKKLLNDLIGKRGPIDLVLTNNSDLAVFAGSVARGHLFINLSDWRIAYPDNFYDKLEMKTALVRNDRSIRTAEFIPFNAPDTQLGHFVESTPFPLILKKRRSAAAVGIKDIQDRCELKKLLAKVKDKNNYLLERFVIGQSLRIDGEIVDNEVILTIPSFMRTSPLEHFQGGKARVQTTIDENEIPIMVIRDFSDRVLKALGMYSGTFHIEAIYSQTDKELYFVEVGARPGAGNMELALREMHQYDALRNFYFRQFPLEFWNSESSLSEMVAAREELFVKPRDRSNSGDVYAILSYPFQDSNRFSFQRVKTNLSPLNLLERTEGLKTFKGCDFSDTLANADFKELESTGINVFRYPYEIGNMAISCRFEGPRDQVERDLKRWNELWQFDTMATHSIMNRLIPRKLLTAGGL